MVSICGHVFCNQCICEHLTSDENQCPSTNCKVQLNVSSVFSKATLKSSLSDLPVQDVSHHCSGSELDEALGPCPENGLYDSSKIRAALEVLQSLSKPRDCTLGNSSLKSSNETANGLENLSDSRSEELLKEACDEKSVVLDKGSIAVVGEKAIVFSQWTRMLDLLESCLKNSSIQYRRLDGTMSVVARDKAVKDFNTLPEVCENLFLLIRCFDILEAFRIIIEEALISMQFDSIMLIPAFSHLFLMLDSSSCRSLL